MAEVLLDAKANINAADKVENYMNTVVMWF